LNQLSLSSLVSLLFSLLLLFFGGGLSVGQAEHGGLNEAVLVEAGGEPTGELGGGVGGAVQVGVFDVLEGGVHPGGVVAAGGGGDVHAAWGGVVGGGRRGHPRGRGVAGGGHGAAGQWVRELGFQQVPDATGVVAVVGSTGGGQLPVVAVGPVRGERHGASLEVKTPQVLRGVRGLVQRPVHEQGVDVGVGDVGGAGTVHMNPVAAVGDQVPVGGDLPGGGEAGGPVHHAGGGRKTGSPGSSDWLDFSLLRDGADPAPQLCPGEGQGGAWGHLPGHVGHHMPSGPWEESRIVVVLERVVVAGAYLIHGGIVLWFRTDQSSLLLFVVQVDQLFQETSVWENATFGSDSTQSLSQG